MRAKPNDMPDTDPLGSPPMKPVRNAQRVALALAPTVQKAMIPAARANSSQMKAAMLREWQTVNQAGLSPQRCIATNIGHER